MKDHCKCVATEMFCSERPFWPLPTQAGGTQDDIEVDHTVSNDPLWSMRTASRPVSGKWLTRPCRPTALMMSRERLDEFYSDAMNKLVREVP